ncbi:nucleotide sugar dehydrogenase [Marinoscillum sp. MHG1-6]|uniref:nucleotide sugar dehydrogenase n=1 Tax=Marinoscillum sp. MHG1-6 TaxID=2959627 RepID=UPI0021578CEA|nr:nucleotide sugar dehydrogenase [Marinoscillum sp. MHG1-6]
MDYRVAVIGLGYVGLPLAVTAGRQYPTVGFDINSRRIAELEQGVDRTKEVDVQELSLAKSLKFTSDSKDLGEVNFYIITVPTPIDANKKPDLQPLAKASATIAGCLKPGDIVVYESTVYPGCTEEFCVPILERESGLKFNKDFYCGYSPERINPGDKEHRLTNILKVTSGSTPEVAEKVDKFYHSIIDAGTFKASSIKVAEAAKVIENSQRDINIAFVNELAHIFHKMGIDTREVLEAAGTKWNFLPFTPGLVGGHCIGVDPYYLTHKSEELGYHPQVILSGRKINDHMGAEVAQRTIKLMSQKKVLGPNAKVLILGLTFKENCPDIRNTGVIEVLNELKSYAIDVDVYDPHADPGEAKEEYQVDLISQMDPGHYQAIILAVAHNEFKALPWAEIRLNTEVIFDVKGILSPDLVDSRL